MSFNKKIAVFLLATSALFASSGHVETDFVSRTINFVIFAAIIYYLLADRTKEFFANRSKSIQAQIDEVNATLEASLKKVEDAKAELENAKKIAKELVESANKEVEVIQKKVQENVEKDIENLYRHFEQKQELEVKKMKKEVVSSVLEKLFASDVTKLSSKELSKIVASKVA